MNVRAIQTFDDLEENITRHENEEFKCNKERALKLEHLKLVKIISIDDDNTIDGSEIISTIDESVSKSNIFSNLSGWMKNICNRAKGITFFNKKGNNKNE